MSGSHQGMPIEGAESLVPLSQRLNPAWNCSTYCSDGRLARAQLKRRAFPFWKQFGSGSTDPLPTIRQIRALSK
jgi:hypothetical protein